MKEVSSLQDATSSPLMDMLWPSIGIFGVFVMLFFGWAALTGRTDAIGSFFMMVLGSAAIAGLVMLVAGVVQEKEDWKAYAAEHCQVVEKRDGQTTTGLGLSMNGKVGTFVGSTDAQTAYKCDDGVTYWKND